MPEPPDAPPIDSGPEGCAPGELAEGDLCRAPGIASCPEGFDGIDGGCVAVLPEGECPSGTMAVPGDAFCHEPSPCAEGTWGDIPVEAGTHYVDGSYAGTSTGAAAQPWRSIGAAVDAAPTGSMIAVAAGTYPESISLRNKSLRIWGKCASMVHVGSASGTTILIENDAHGSEIHTVGIGGSFGVANGGSQNVLIDRAWIHDTASRGVLTENSLGDASTIIVGSLIERATEVGISGFGGILFVEDTVVRATRLDSGSGRGISVRAGSDLTLMNSVIEQNHDLGVLVSGSVGHVERTLIRDTQPNAGLSGGGLAFQPDSATLIPASGTVDGVVVERNQTYGVLVHGSLVALSRLTVRDTYPQQLDGSVGIGVQIQADDVTGAPADVTLEQLLSERNHYGGLAVSGAHIEASRVLVRDLFPEPASGEHGRGVLAFWDRTTHQGVTGRFRGVRIERAVEAGFFAQGVDITLEDIVVSGTYPRPDGEIGRGICFQSENEAIGSNAWITRAWLEQNHDAGLFFEGTTAVVDRITVRDTASTVAADKFGDAIQILSEVGLPLASATITNAHIEGSHRAGVAAYGAAVSLESSALECNPIDLNGQKIAEQPFDFRDAGDNRCACGDEVRACRVLSNELEPPSPLP